MFNVMPRPPLLGSLYVVYLYLVSKGFDQSFPLKNS